MRGDSAKATETCLCGAQIEVEVASHMPAGAVRERLAEFRSAHAACRAPRPLGVSSPPQDPDGQTADSPPAAESSTDAERAAIEREEAAHPFEVYADHGAMRRDGFQAMGVEPNPHVQRTWRP